MTEATFSKSEYKYGFVTDIETADFPVGLNEQIIHKLSDLKREPDFVREFRLKAYRYWRTLKEPKWAKVSYPAIDFESIRYYSAPKTDKPEDAPRSLADVDPALLETFNKLGIPLAEQQRLTGVAVDVVFDSVSLGTTH